MIGQDEDAVGRVQMKGDFTRRNVCQYAQDDAVTATGAELRDGGLREVITLQRARRVRGKQRDGLVHGPTQTGPAL